MIQFPHINTALKGPLLELEKICLSQQQEIETWFRRKWHENKAPFYGSVDLRNSAFKLAPVDMNLYPGGFNNLSQQFIPLAVHAVNSWLAFNCHTTCRILLIPENHTRNQFYLQNLYTLYKILQQSGIDVQIGSIDPAITTITEMDIFDGKKMLYHPLKRVGNRIMTIEGFDPCMVLLNNDLSAGKPEILVGIEQKLLPPLNAGWYMRKKSNFFTQFDKVALEFAALLEIDQWKINPYFDSCSGLNFATRVGIDELAIKVDKIIEKIKLKYTEYNISEDPYVIVKADNGTYGMGIMVVKSGQEILDINRKHRNKMAVIKDGIHVSDVIIQEGVHTVEELDGNIAEPVVYMLDQFVIGGFYRVHPEKGKADNLNAVGMKFMPLSFSSPCIANLDGEPDCPPNRFYTYGVIARLSMLAASYELEVYK